jgi:hypothetical protein
MSGHTPHSRSEIFVLCVQSLLGIISPNIRAVAVVFLSDGRIEMHFALEVDDPEDR